jgi:hypothetical protein
MKVGSFVECIDDKFSNEQLTKLNKVPKEGDYYTIRDIVEYPEYNRVGVRLEEISNPPIDRDGSPHEPSFGIFRFRELEIPPPMELKIREILDNDLELVETEDDGLFRKIYN